MTYKGHVRNNVVVFDDDVNLPDGAEAVVEIVNAAVLETKGKTLRERFGSLVGSVPDLPEDFADNHDHYIHGAPKR